MFYVKLPITITAERRVAGSGENKKAQFQIDLYCSNENYDKDGKVVDFGKVKERAKKALEQKNLNEVLADIPTMESMAQYLTEIISTCYKVKVSDSKGRQVVYTKDGIMKQRRKSY